MLQHDFLVLDLLLKQEYLEHCVNALLQSSVWFDSSNGVAVVSHHDQGLIFPSIRVLAQVNVVDCGNKIIVVCGSGVGGGVRSP